MRWGRIEANGIYRTPRIKAETKRLRKLRRKARKAKRAARGFYTGDQWLKVRYRALKSSNGRCQCCGARPTKKKPLHVDHIKPRSKFPELALNVENLQVLCEDCNLGKSNLDATDWREQEFDEDVVARLTAIEQQLTPRG